MVGKPITILSPADRPDEEPEILARVRRGERVHHYETVRRRKDGTLVDISLTVSPVKDAQSRIIGASKIARDITDRKLTEAKLRENERHLQELIAAIPAGIYTTDADGKITYFNQAAVELAGRTPTIGSDEWCVTWKLYHPDGTPLPHDRCPMAIALKEGRPIRNAEVVAERPDGTRVPFIPYPTPQNMGLQARRALARGGRTAGLAANPARNGNPSPHGVGPSLVPNGMPTQESALHSARSTAQIPGLVRAGQTDAARGGQLMRQHQVHLDNYAKQKRSAAVKSSKPKVRGPSFGSISDGRDDVNQTSLLTDGRQSDVPGGSAMGTTRSPFNQGNQSGGASAVPNSSFMPGGRRGPGYDW